MPQFMEKDPNSKRDFSVDLSGVLPTGVTISTVTWVVPSGLVSEAVSNTTTVATIRLSGGTLGETYQVVCRTTWSNSEIDDRTIKIRLVSK